MPRPQPARQKVIDKLSELLSESDTAKIPSIRRLAFLLGVSATTVWKEIKKLEKEKRLVTRWGHNIEIHGRKERKPVHISEGLKWQQARDRIKEEIRAGFYVPASTLPPKKQLMQKM